MPSAIPVSLSYASSIVGLISFVFTLSIFFGTFSAAIGNFLTAPHEIRDSLSTFRFELYEERDALRRARTRQRRQSTKPVPSPTRSRSRGAAGRRSGLRGGALDNEKRPSHHRTVRSTSRSTSDWLRICTITIRDLLRDFRHLEHPFLVTNPSQPDQKDWDADSDIEARTHIDTAENPWRYYTCNFSRRIIWLRTKEDVRLLAEKVQRVQVTRIEREGHETHMSLVSLGSLLRDIDERLRGIEERLRIR